MLAFALLVYSLETGKWWNPDICNVFIIGLVLYFTVQGLALLYTHN